MKRYWQILKRYKISLMISPLLVLIGVVCETIQPRFMAKIVDEGVMLRNLDLVAQTGIYMVIISIAGLIASAINIYISSHTSIGFGSDLRNKMFEKIQELSFAEIDRLNPASLITRLTNDIIKVQQVVLMSMRILLRSPLMLIMALFFVLTTNVDLALILLLSIPVLGTCAYFIMKKGFPFFIKVQQKIDRLNGVVMENLINIRVVKSFVREEYETRKFVKSSDDLRDTSIKASNTIITIFPAMQLVMNLSIIALLWFGGNKITTGELKVGELISFVNYLTQVMISLMMLSMIIMSFARASASSERIVEVLDTSPSLADTPEVLKNRYTIERGDISFDNVSFHYTAGENDILKNISFTVAHGETIALVGATGSAKSTLVQLIPRLYDPTEGEVFIDGRNIKSYTIDELHSKVGMVLQNNELFSGTIAENLRWGKDDATQEDIEEVTKAAQAHDFITSFPNGYQTLLGRGGVNISGGQKQRICIARALLRKPKILILDDSTSAIDSETEQKIRHNLDTLMHETTVIVITQRVHSMQRADRIIVLDDGEIDAIGRPEELIKSSKTYQEICRSQQTILE